MRTLSPSHSSHLPIHSTHISMHLFIGNMVSCDLIDLYDCLLYLWILKAKSHVVKNVKCCNDDDFHITRQLIITKRYISFYSSATELKSGKSTNFHYCMGDYSFYWLVSNICCLAHLYWCHVWSYLYYRYSIYSTSMEKIVANSHNFSSLGCRAIGIGCLWWSGLFDELISALHMD